jgi:signal transduction histidine kinase
MIFLAVALDWRIRKAIKDLIAATRALAQGQLDDPVRVGTGDELDALGDSVNRMAEVLRDSEARVKHWHEELERTISQRTEELEQSQALLARQEKVAALGLMAAGVAHEIGNPLAAISTILQRIDSEVPPKLREKCKTMTQQVERISKIVDEMRQFARPASSNERRVNINEALRMSAQICRYDPRAKRVKIDTRLDSEVPAVRGNADRWQQVFLNLIFNALEAMPDGGELGIVSRNHNDQVMLSFRDTGVGMSTEQIRNLFHPFYSVKQSGRGFGLGLSVCQGIVNSYGGTIEVESEPACGTEFRIIIPAHGSGTTKGEAGEALQTTATKAAQPDVPAHKPHVGRA